MSVTRGAAWIPTTALIVGALLLTGVRAQSRPELRMPLADALPDSVGDWLGTDLEVTDAEADVAGFTDYALRVFQAPDGAADRWASVYLGFYDQQSRGRTIHSPKNCLPGSGWEALSATTQDIQVDGETFTEWSGLRVGHCCRFAEVLIELQVGNLTHGSRSSQHHDRHPPEN